MHIGFCLILICNFLSFCNFQLKKEKKEKTKQNTQKHIREPGKMLWDYSHILWKSELKKNTLFKIISLLFLLFVYLFCISGHN